MISRRGMLGKTAAGAAAVTAALALPAGKAQAANSTPRPCCPCNPPKGIMKRDEAKEEAAWQVLMNSGPAVRAAAFTFDQLQGIAWIAEYEMMAAEFGRHFPGFEIAVKNIADHIIDESVLTQGCACFG